MATAQERLQALLESMKSPVDENAPQNVTGIIYGDNGTGKTVLAVQLAQAIVDLQGRIGDPSKPEILFVDAVNAWRSLKNHPGMLDDLKRIPYAGKEQLETLIDAIQWRPPGFENVKVVILDEMSSMTDKDGDVVLAARVADTAKFPGKDPDVLTQPDMGATTERMRRVVVRLLQQEISVIFVAHVRNDEDKEKGFQITRPRFMPKFSGTIREGLDFVAHMSAQEVGTSDGNIVYQRRLQMHPSRAVVAKSRIGGLNTFVSPDEFVSGTIKWLKGDVGDSNVTSIVDDRNPDVVSTGEDTNDNDFVGVTVN